MFLESSPPPHFVTLPEIFWSVHFLPTVLFFLSWPKPRLVIPSTLFLSLQIILFNCCVVVYFSLTQFWMQSWISFVFLANGKLRAPLEFDCWIFSATTVFTLHAREDFILDVFFLLKLRFYSNSSNWLIVSHPALKAREGMREWWPCKHIHYWPFIREGGSCDFLQICRDGLAILPPHLKCRCHQLTRRLDSGEWREAVPTDGNWRLKMENQMEGSRKIYLCCFRPALQNH